MYTAPSVLYMQGIKGAISHSLQIITPYNAALSISPPGRRAIHCILTSVSDYAAQIQHTGGRGWGLTDLAGGPPPTSQFLGRRDEVGFPFKFSSAEEITPVFEVNIILITITCDRQRRGPSAASAVSHTPCTRSTIIIIIVPASPSAPRPIYNTHDFIAPQWEKLHPPAAHPLYAHGVEGEGAPGLPDPVTYTQVRDDDRRHYDNLSNRTARFCGDRSLCVGMKGVQ